MIVKNKPTLCSDLTFNALKNGITVPLGKMLEPNNGLKFCSQFEDTVNMYSAVSYCIPFDIIIIQNVVSQVQEQYYCPLTWIKHGQETCFFLTRQVSRLLHCCFCEETGANVPSVHRTLPGEGLHSEAPLKGASTA